MSRNRVSAARLVIGIVYIIFPWHALAQNPGPIQTLIFQTQNSLFGVTILLFSVATAVFFWAAIRLIKSGADPEERAKAKRLLTLGIIGMAVMVSVWGIVRAFVWYFGVGGIGIPVPR